MESPRDPDRPASGCGFGHPCGGPVGPIASARSSISLSFQLVPLLASGSGGLAVMTPLAERLRLSRIGADLSGAGSGCSRTVLASAAGQPRLACLKCVERASLSSSAPRRIHGLVATSKHFHSTTEPRRCGRYTRPSVVISGSSVRSALPRLGKIAWSSFRWRIFSSGRGLRPRNCSPGAACSPLASRSSGSVVASAAPTSAPTWPRDGEICDTS